MMGRCNVKVAKDVGGSVMGLDKGEVKMVSDIRGQRTNSFRLSCERS